MLRVTAFTLTGLLVASAAFAQTPGSPWPGVDPRAPNAPDQKPAVAGQTRAPEKKLGVAFKVVPVADGFQNPWSLAFLPGGKMLVTERPGRLRVVSADGSKSEPVAGLPAVDARNQGGLLDVALDPAFAKNGLIYWSYSEPGPDGANNTAVARGTFVDGAAPRVDHVQVIFHQAPSLDSRLHFGSRLVWGRDGTLFITMGDRSITEGRMQAQRMDGLLGKIARINADGSIPKDNPFVNASGAVPSIWTLGNRNPEGLAIDPRSGLMWGSDNGPTGGDELNLVEKGRNYGWGVVSMGLQPGITRQHQDGMDDPIRYYTPSIAPSGIHFYTGSRYPGWKNSLFLSALAGQKLIRYEINGRKVTHEEVVFKGFGRVRQVITGPDGYLYVLIQNSQSLANSPGMVIRLLPQ